MRKCGAETRQQSNCSAISRICLSKTGKNHTNCHQLGLGSASVLKYRTQKSRDDSTYEFSKEIMLKSAIQLRHMDKKYQSRIKKHCSVVSVVWQG